MTTAPPRLQQRRLDELDSRIVGALQVDGRAPWHRIARVLGEQERTIARRGTELISSGVVRITGYVLGDVGAIVKIRCTPGQARVAGGSLARRDDMVFAHVLAGVTTCVAQVSCSTRGLAGLIMDELPAIPGALETTAFPLLRYIRTAHEWHPGLITDEERVALEESTPVVQRRHFGGISDLARGDQLLLKALSTDARRTYEELSRLTGMSEATVRRHVESFRRDGRVLVRAVVDPSVVGLPIEAVLWVDAPPGDVDEVADGLADSKFVRFACRVTGDHEFFVLATLPTLDALDEFTSRSPWLAKVSSMETSLIVSTLKRSGLQHFTE